MMPPENETHIFEDNGSQQEVLDAMDWDKYRNNNITLIPAFTLILGGGVRLRQHFDVPLSPQLWVDLVCRLRIRALSIYTIGADPPQNFWAECVIILDDEGNVADIELTGLILQRRAIDHSIQRFAAAGIAIEHVDGIARADFS